jgi:hypothetical protein
MLLDGVKDPVHSSIQPTQLSSLSLRPLRPLRLNPPANEHDIIYIKAQKNQS